MPPAIASNPVAELRSGNTGRIATNSGGGVRFATVHLSLPSPLSPSPPPSNPFESTIAIHRHQPSSTFHPSTLLIVRKFTFESNVAYPPQSFIHGSLHTVARIIETPNPLPHQFSVSFISKELLRVYIYIYTPPPPPPPNTSPTFKEISNHRIPPDSISAPDYFRLRQTGPTDHVLSTKLVGWRESWATSRTSLEMYKRENCLPLEESPSIKFSWFVGG